MKIMKKVIVNINLEIPALGAMTNKEAEIIAENYELPHGYVEDSFKMVKVIEEECELQKWTTTLTSTIYAHTKREALKLFLDDCRNIDDWNTGENITIEKEEEK